MIERCFLHEPNRIIQNMLKNKYLAKNGGRKISTWASKKLLVTLINIEMKELYHGSLVKFLNNFVI
jgi:hypothetical protein